jgi:predicted branched-subunit amino acid permease
LKKEFIAGLKAELPLLIGVIPFGMIYGVLALDAGIPPAAAQAMSSILFAGSAQIIVTQLVSQGTPALVIVLTVAIVNLRHALYSASLAPYTQRLRPAWKWLLAYLLTDEAYAVTILYYEPGSPPTAVGTSLAFSSSQSAMPDEAGDPPDTLALQPDMRHWFFLAAGLALWTTWQLSTAAGILLGAIIPQSWSLDFTLALTFIALVVPALRDRPGLAAALSAGIVALVAYSWPYKLGLVTAAVAGILVGLLVEGRK